MILTAGLAAPLAPMPALASSPASEWPPATPEASLRLYARIVGNAAGGRTYLQYDCDVAQLGDRRVTRPMYRVRGIARTNWTKLEGGAFSAISFDHGLVCDAETGRVIDSYHNPLNGITTRPIHYRSGPFFKRLLPTDDAGRPFKVAWQTAGGAIWFTETLAGKRANRLKLDTWGTASTGPEVYLATRSTYVAELELLKDEARSAVPATHQWTYTAPYEPWMLMGAADGFQIWQWVGRKIIDPRQLDPNLVGEINRRWPPFFNDGPPWDGFINGAIQYMRERRPL